jgi:hypothetical protein
LIDFSDGVKHHVSKIDVKTIFINELGLYAILPCYSNNRGLACRSMSKIDEQDKIYLKELCELVYSYTPESKRAKIKKIKNLYNKTLILYDLITRVKTSPCL